MAQSNIRARTRTIQESVDSKAERLTTLARQQHGLTTEDIDDCIIQSLQRVQAERRWLLPWIWGKLAKGVIILVIVCLCLLVIIVNHKPSKHYLDLLSFNTSYPAMRVVRLLTLPLARRVDLSRFYNGECALPNPLYMGDFDVDCYPCQFVTHVQTIQGISSQHSFGRPFILKPKPVFLGYVWLSQAHGSREIVLSPVPECKTNCTEFSVVLEPGHVLFLDMRYWELQSFPFGDDVSISCMGSYA